MNGKMTPCEKLGYKVGDKFTVIKDYLLEKGTSVVLSEDDGSEVPWFTCGSVRRALIIGSDSDVEPVAKLKPAKQSLADAIHQNGGWPIEVHWLFSTSSRVGAISFWVCRPKFNSTDWFKGVARRVTVMLNRGLPNWHQTILSRDEYFTAYPDQVKVEVNNETKNQIEVEMKSESEMTIKVGDWNKNGELPPVGEVCLWIGRKENGDYRADLRTGDRVEVIAHYKPRSDGAMVAVFAYESRESIGRQTDQSIAKCFSPLRTEREKAIDEMVGVARDIGYSSNNSIAIIGDVASAMYDLGYRKEAK